MFKAKGKVQEDSNKLFIKPERWQNFSCELNKNQRDEHGYPHFEEGWIAAVKFLMELILVNTLLSDEGLFLH